MIGITLDISSEISTSTAPGRVLSPPISIISAPSEIIDFKCTSAVSTEEYFPPSEKLSGVTFNIPITLGTSKESLQIFTLSLVILCKILSGIFFAKTIWGSVFLASFSAWVNQKCVPRMTCALSGMERSVLSIGRKYSVIFNVYYIYSENIFFQRQYNGEPVFIIEHRLYPDNT